MLRFVKFVALPLVCATFYVGPAHAQATRTWVSGVGDDANPCSRTAPCKTFAGAISKTAAGGEINVIDPGGFGGVTITKSLTIKAEGLTGGVLVSLTGVKVQSARSVHIIDSEIYQFKAGISVQSTVPTTNVFVWRSHI